MFNRADPRRTSRTHAIALALLIAPCVSLATTEETPPPAIAPTALAAPPAHLVRELLEEDAQRALVNERITAATQSGAGSAAAAAPPLASFGMTTATDGTAQATPGPRPRSAEPLRLKNIVGVGRRLSALVNIEGHDALYRVGHARAVSGDDSGWRLLQITPPCVELADPSTEVDRRVRACLNEVPK